MKFILFFSIYFSFLYASDTRCVEGELLKLYNEQQTKIQSLQKEINSLKFKTTSTVKSIKQNETAPHDYQTNQIMIYQDLNDLKDQNKSSSLTNEKILLDFKGQTKDLLSELYRSSIERNQLLISIFGTALLCLAICFGFWKKGEIKEAREELKDTQLELKDNFKEAKNSLKEDFTKTKDELKEFKEGINTLLASLNNTTDEYKESLKSLNKTNIENFREEITTILEDALRKYSGLIATEINNRTYYNQFSDSLKKIEDQLTDFAIAHTLPPKQAQEQVVEDNSTLDINLSETTKDRLVKLKETLAKEQKGKING